MPELQRIPPFYTGFSLDEIRPDLPEVDNQYFSVLKSVKIMPDISYAGYLRLTLFDRPLFLYSFIRFLKLSPIIQLIE